MRKIFVITALLLILLVAFVGCENNVSNETGGSNEEALGNSTNNINVPVTEDPSSELELPSYISYKNSKYFLTLPLSGEELKLDKYIHHFTEIDFETIRTAEAIILAQVPQDVRSSVFYLSEDENGYLCLCKELVVDIVPPKAGMGGCGYDHDHVFLKEPLTVIQETESVDKTVLLSTKDGIVGATVSSLPQGCYYEFDSEKAGRIAEYLINLNLVSRFEENPDEYGGFTWIIEIEYSDGTKEIVVFFRPFIRVDGGKWYKTEGLESRCFEDLLEELNK